MRQVRITSRDIDRPTDEDCVIAADDELNFIKQQQMLGGLKPAHKDFKTISYPTLGSKEANEIAKSYYDHNMEDNMAMPKK